MKWGNLCFAVVIRCQRPWNTAAVGLDLTEELFSLTFFSIVNGAFLCFVRKFFKTRGASQTL